MNIKEILKKDIKNVLLKIDHPEINSNLVKLGMIKDIKLKNGFVSIILALPFLEIPIKEDIVNLIKKSINNLYKNWNKNH